MSIPFPGTAGTRTNRGRNLVPGVPSSTGNGRVALAMFLRRMGDFGSAIRKPGVLFPVSVGTVGTFLKAEPLVVHTVPGNRKG